MTDNSINHKTFVAVKRIKVSKGLSIQTDAGWERYELGYEIGGTFQDEQIISNLEDNALENIERKLRTWTNKDSEMPAGFDIDAIKWEPSQGAHGPFERSVDIENPEFKKAVKILTPCRKLVWNKWFIWLFKDNKTLGRKPAREQPQ